MEINLMFNRKLTALGLGLLSVGASLLTSVLPASAYGDGDDPATAHMRVTWDSTPVKSDWSQRKYISGTKILILKRIAETGYVNNGNPKTYLTVKFTLPTCNSSHRLYSTFTFQIKDESARVYMFGSYSSTPSEEGHTITRVFDNNEILPDKAGKLLMTGSEECRPI
jgi:hypothetical protein